MGEQAEGEGVGAQQFAGGDVEVPFPDRTMGEIDRIVRLGNRTYGLGRKRDDPNADVSELARAIDRLVYGMYGLTEQEIRLVEAEIERLGR